MMSSLSMIWLFFYAFIQVLDGASWTVVNNYKYNIQDTFSAKEKLPYEESKELCEFLGEDSRLFEPTDKETLTNVLNKIKEMNLPDDTSFWINAIRTDSGFQYVESGLDVGIDAPWADWEPNNANDGEKCVEAMMNGKWNDIACSSARIALCQAPLEWTLVGDNLYLLEDAINQGPIGLWDAKHFCEGYEFQIFEPRDLASQTAVLAKIPTEHSTKRFWVNAARSLSEKKWTYMSEGYEPIPSELMSKVEQDKEYNYAVVENGKWKNIQFQADAYAICQKPYKQILPMCEDEEEGGKYPELNSKEQLESALDWFCKLDETKQTDFLTCPQVGDEATSYFALVKAVGACDNKEVLQSYINGCNYICQSLKAQGLENVKSAEKNSNILFAKQIADLDSKIDYWTVGVSSLESLSAAYADFKEFDISKNVNSVKQEFIDQIEAIDGLDDKTKAELEERVTNAFDSANSYGSTSAYNNVKEKLNQQIAQAAEQQELAMLGKDKIVKKKNTLTAMYNECRVNLQSMTKVEAVGKASESIGHISTGLQKIIGANGDWKQILSGSLDMVNALSLFLPPPVSSLTGAVSDIYNMFLGGGSTDTASLIKNEFEKQTAMILDQFDRLRNFFTEALDIQRIEELKMVAQGVLADLTIKQLFVDSFRDQGMSEDLAREIKNEIQSFQNNRDIAVFRLTFNEYCKDFYTNYHTYAVNTDLEVKDKDCLFLVFTYVMIEVTGQSVMTSMMSKLKASESKYLAEMTDGFAVVQQHNAETTKNWLNGMFKEKGHVICAAFKHDASMWSHNEQQALALLYIGAIDKDLRTYIEEYDCQAHIESAKNFVHVDSQLIVDGGKEIALGSWGKSFIVDFFLAFSVCKGGTAINGKLFKKDRCRYVTTCADAECQLEEKECQNNAPSTKQCIKEKRFSFGGVETSLGSSNDHSILHITNGKKKTLGYYFPSVVMRTQNEMGIYMPKSDEWNYRKDYNFGFDHGPGSQTWHHVTISQLEEAGDSSQENFQMSVRVDGVLIQKPITNNLGKNYEGIKAYISSPDNWSLGRLASWGTLDKHSVHNLRFIESRQRYTVNLGKKVFTIRIGPATLADAKAFCKSEGKIIYQPTYESIHKLIYNKVSKYGVTTFWTRAQYQYHKNDKNKVNLTSGTMKWMDSTGNSAVPSWIYNQWKHTHELYKRHGGCVVAGVNDRGFQLTAVDCNTEVADTVCQPA